MGRRPSKQEISSEIDQVIPAKIRSSYKSRRSRWEKAIDMQQPIQIFFTEPSAPESAKALYTALGGERGPSVIVQEGSKCHENLHLAMADALFGRQILVFFAGKDCVSDQHDFCALRRELEVHANRPPMIDSEQGCLAQSLDAILIARSGGQNGADDPTCPLRAKCLAARNTPDLAKRVKTQIARNASLLKSTPHAVVNVVNRLAARLQAEEDNQAARDLYKMAVDVSRTTFGDTDPVTLLSMNRYASLLLAMKDLPGACTVQRILYHVYNECLEKDDPERTLSAANLFITLIMLGYEGEAELVFHGELKWLLDEDPEKLTEKQARIGTLLRSVTNVRPVHESH